MKINSLINNLFKRKKNILETERLILRPWKYSDLDDLFFYAQDERVGPQAGWAAHKTIEDSRAFLDYLRTQKYVYAIVPKNINRAIGSIALMRGKESNFPLPNSEAEIGYWLGYPFWGNGLVPEATKEIIRYGFEDLKLKKIWCGYFDGNENSKIVQAKCGFQYDHTERNVYWNALNAFKTEHITKIDRKDYFKNNG